MSTWSAGQTVWAAALTGVALASACGGRATSEAGQEPDEPGKPGGGGMVCRYDSKTYRPGESFPDVDGCNSCSCEPDGAVSCTARGCARTCVVDGKSYLLGESFPAPDGCNTCSCDRAGIHCTQMECAEGCTYAGRKYAIGESFSADNGCNTCSCVARATGSPGVDCTKLPCPQPTCRYLGELRSPGESFPSRDGCNTCQCSSDGSVACTEKACPCQPAAEWWRNYVGMSPGLCTVIDFGCPSFTTMFGNDCGCGCEQADHCPQYQSCVVPENCSQCPYSAIVMN